MVNNPRLNRRLLPGTLTVSGTPVQSAAPAISVSTVASFVTDEAKFLANLSVIDEVAARVCRRHRLNASETEEFQSDVRLHFIERNYEVLRRFEGRSSVTTYITVVIQRLFLDRRNRLWGKWRPSSDARRLGPSAILLERLVTRDGWPCEQALEMLRVNHGIAVTAALRALADRAGRRPASRQILPEERAGEVAATTPTPEANVLRAEQDFVAKRVQTALDRAAQSLTAEERLVLKMRFEDGAPVATIARALHLDQKRLYRTLHTLLESVGAALAAEGISADDARALLAVDEATPPAGGTRASAAGIHARPAGARAGTGERHGR